MARARRRRLVAAVGGLVLVTLAPPALSRAAGTPTSTPVPTAVPRGLIRLDQQGYLPSETKPARLMAPRAVSRVTFVVTDGAGHVVLHGRVPTAPAGSWSRRFPDVYRLDVTGLRKPGRYRVVTAGGIRAASPWFRVMRAGRLFGTLLDAGVAFDQTQRDGPRVIPGRLHRRASHLLDRHATVYAWPHMAPGSDLITDRRLRPLGGPRVDVAGGWFDASDYLKFTHSTAYNDVLLFTSARLLGRRAP